MTVRTYSSPEAFKQALEQRFRTAEKTGAEMARRRQLLVFDRFLARVGAVPAKLPGPPASWASPYAAMAREDQLIWPTLDDVTRVAQAFLGPVLAGNLDATWEPEAWVWRLH